MRAWGIVVAVAVGVAGCSGEVGELYDGEGELFQVEGELSSAEVNGGKLFAFETFKGNGRTCATCHAAWNGTISPQQIQQARADSPLFRKIDADDPNAARPTYNLLKRDATFNVTIPLPRNVVIIGKPNQRTFTVRRGTPSVLDTPALDSVLMADGRAPTLQAQAQDAIATHMQPGRQATATELNQIAAFQKKLFSSRELRRLAEQGTPVGLPAGNTPSEKRGRAFFEPGESACGACHFGELLNGDMAGFPPLRFIGIGVSNVNKNGYPMYEFGIKNANGTITKVEDPNLGGTLTSDPGRFLITGDPGDFNSFKNGSLRNIKNTAPYFHDNSAKTLEEVMDHYDLYVPLFGFPPMTAHDKKDIINYMKLL